MFLLCLMPACAWVNDLLLLCFCLLLPCCGEALGVSFGGLALRFGRPQGGHEKLLNLRTRQGNLCQTRSSPHKRGSADVFNCNAPQARTADPHVLAPRFVVSGCVVRQGWPTHGLGML